MDKITFNNKEHTKESVSKLDDAGLLSLRNLVAENLDVARVKSFRDHNQGVEDTWGLLNKWASQDDGASGGKAKAKAKDKPKEPPPPAKCAKSQTVKRPTRGMFRRLQKIKEHPGKGFRIRRWDNYKDGMTLLDCAEGDETTPLDVGYYVEHGLMKLIEPTEEEFQKGLDAWYKKHGLENPAEAKRKRDEERAKKKAEREAAAAAKKKEKEEAAAKKKAEAEAKKKAAADKKAA